MPPPTTLRDVAPHLDKLRHLIVMPQITKNDLDCRADIAEHLANISTFDIEAIAIETHALGQIGIVMADTVRNCCAEILSRLQTFWHDSYAVLDRQDRLKNDDFDDYEINHLFKEIESFELNLQLYRNCLMAVNKLPLPKDCEIDKYRQEIGMCLLEESREKWLKAKYGLTKALQKSTKFDEFLDKPKQRLYSSLREVCRKIFRTVELYFQPCEIRLTPKLRETFIEYFQQPNGSYAGPPIIHRNPGKAMKSTEEDAPTDGASKSKETPEVKRDWNMELFPMILVSELYVVCSDVFDSTETQFHSSLNLHGKHEPIKIRPKQKIKACYLISKLYEIVPAKHRAAWRDDILAHLDIQWSYYEKKYCHPRGDDASLSSKEYADEIDRIFKNHKKRA